MAEKDKPLGPDEIRVISRSPIVVMVPSWTTPIGRERVLEAYPGAQLVYADPA